MRPLSDTIARLRAAVPAAGKLTGTAPSPRLVDIVSDHPNPGALGARGFVPEGRSGMALVVVLHGCTQTADGYDRGSGWSDLAERHGFAVLLPEQSTANNANRCFNWFVPDDARRGSGEAASIRGYVATMVDRHAIDPARVFVTGLSAGGAMTSIMLAAYPDVFAGGAIIAGLPFGTAASVPQAFDRMRGHGHPPAARAGDLVRAASPHDGPWPTISVWHGDADTTVVAANADAILAQWQAVHGLTGAADRQARVDGAVRRQWVDDGGRVCIEDYRIAGMGHGTPLGTRGDTAAGTPMPYMLDVGLSSTWHVADAWGILDPAAAAPRPATERARTTNTAIPVGASGGVGATIEAALRLAGLLR